MKKMDNSHADNRTISKVWNEKKIQYKKLGYLLLEKLQFTVSRNPLEIAIPEYIVKLMLGSLQYSVTVELGFCKSNNCNFHLGPKST